MISQRLLIQVIFGLVITFGKADVDPLEGLFTKCCDTGKRWFHDSEDNECPVFPQPQDMRGLDSLTTVIPTGYGDLSVE